MKKNTMIAIANYIKNVPELAEQYAELEAELAKGEAKAQANRDLYASAHDVVMAHLSDVPMTVAQIVEACGDELPEGMSKGKIQYAILNYWNNEVEKIENVKGANQYKKRA